MRAYIIKNDQVMAIRQALGPLPNMAVDPIIGILDRLRPYEEGMALQPEATGDYDLDYLTKMVEEIHQRLPYIVKEGSIEVPSDLMPGEVVENGSVEVEDDELSDVEAFSEEELSESSSDVEMVVPVTSDDDVKKAKTKMNAKAKGK